jgi:rod shape-determining protein MreD
MTSVKQQGGWVILLSLAIAFWLQSIPFFPSIEPFRPHWPLLVLIYWSLALPQRPILLYAWLLGIFQDVLHSSIFGLHALSYLLIAFIIVRFYQRVRFFSLIYQAGVIFVCVLFHLFILLWSYQLSGYSVNAFSYWFPALSSALVWPLVYQLLRTLRQRIKVT